MKNILLVLIVILVAACSTPLNKKDIYGLWASMGYSTGVLSKRQLKERAELSGKISSIYFFLKVEANNHYEFSVYGKKSYEGKIELNLEDKTITFNRKPGVTVEIASILYMDDDFLQFSYHDDKERIYVYKKAR